MELNTHQMASNDTAYMRWNCYNGLSNPVQIVLPAKKEEAGNAMTNPGSNNHTQASLDVRYLPQTRKEADIDKVRLD